VNRGCLSIIVEVIIYKYMYFCKCVIMNADNVYVGLYQADYI